MHALKLRIGIAIARSSISSEEALAILSFLETEKVAPEKQVCIQELAFWMLSNEQRKIDHLSGRDIMPESFMLFAFRQFTWLRHFYTAEEQMELFYTLIAEGTN